MKCIGREELLACVLRQLEPRKEREVRAHVAACARCLGVLESYQKLDAVLDEWKPQDPSPWFDARLRQALAGADVREPWRVWAWLAWTQWSWVQISVVVLMVVAATLAVVRLHQFSNGPGSALKSELSQPSQTGRVTSAQPQSSIAGQEDLSLYENLPVLEDYDMLANFDLLSELPKGTKKLAN